MTDMSAEHTLVDSKYKQMLSEIMFSINNYYKIIYLISFAFLELFQITATLMNAGVKGLLNAGVKGLTMMQ